MFHSFVCAPDSGTRDHLPPLIEPLDLAHVTIDVRISAPEPLVLDALLAGIVGRGYKPQVASEPPNQIR